MVGGGSTPLSTLESFTHTHTHDSTQKTQEFHAWLPKLLRNGGHYSFFNGLSPDNIFFHAVTCQVCRYIHSYGCDRQDACVCLSVCRWRVVV